MPRLRESCADLADDLGISADVVRAFEIVKNQRLTVQDRRKMNGLIRRTEKLISDLVSFKHRDISWPSDQALDDYR